MIKFNIKQFLYQMWKIRAECYSTLTKLYNNCDITVLGISIAIILNHQNRLRFELWIFIHISHSFLSFLRPQSCTVLQLQTTVRVNHMPEFCDHYVRIYSVIIWFQWWWILWHHCDAIVNIRQWHKVFLMSFIVTDHMIDLTK